MNRNPDRQTRSSRRRARPADDSFDAQQLPLASDFTDDDPVPPGYDPLSAYDAYTPGPRAGRRAQPPGEDTAAYGDMAEETGAPRRRRSQAARLRDAEGNTITTPTPEELAAEMRYARPANRRQQQLRPAPAEMQAPVPRTREMPRESINFDDPYDDQYDGAQAGYDDYDEEPPKKRRLLRWIIILAVVLALLAGVTYVGLSRPELVEPIVQWGRELILGPSPSPSPSPEPTPAPEATEAPPPDISAAYVIDFSAEPETQPDITQPVLFYVKTTAQTDRLQIVNDNGQLLVEAGEGEYTDNVDGRIWMLRVYFDAAYDGSVEAYPGNEAGWNEANGSRISVKVGDPTEDTGGLTGQFATGGSTLEGGTTATAIDLAHQAVDSESGPLTSYTRATPISLGDAAGYVSESGMRGVLTFRGSNLRQNSAWGSVSPTESKLELRWSVTAGLPSTGDDSFASQPIIVQWHKEIRQLMRMVGDKQNTDKLKEVIFAGNDGYLYFFDLADGSVTRDPLQSGKTGPVPMLGTPSVYPHGFPLLAVGTGIPSNTPSSEDNGMSLLNLIKNTSVGLLRGNSNNAMSFTTDTSCVTAPLIDNDTDSLIFVGGNGLLFTLELGTSLQENSDVMEVTVPRIQGYGSGSGSEGEDTRVESTLAVYEELAYYATKGGVLQCMNLNTLSPVWALQVGADTEAAIALQPTAGGVALYHASKADVEGQAHMRRVDGLTGAIIWDKAVPGSISASPLVGTGALEGMVFFSARNAEAGGTIYALDAETGAVLWEYVLMGTRLASPLALYSGDGRAWIVQGDEGGLLLLEGTQGERLDYLSLDSGVYGSPAAFGDMIVVATITGQLHCVQIR